jgi:MoaA/NifB/PqqE/SkfB family radical SAM enzyme
MAGVFVGGNRTRQERIATSMAEPFLPKWIAWETTQRCNLRCIHCRCSSEMTSAQGDFTTTEAFGLLDQIAELSKPVVVLSGGEPLLRPDVFDIAARHRRSGRMCMATNGTLIDDAVCEKMKAAQLRMVSPRSTARRRRSTTTSARCPAPLRHAARRRVLKKHGIPFLINSSFTKRNQGDIANVMRLAKSLGAPRPGICS